MLADLFDACEALAQRGVIFDQQAQPVGPNAHLWIAAFRTPHGIPIELWGMVEAPQLEEIKEDNSPLDEDGAEQFETGEPEAAELEEAFQAARRRVAADRPELHANAYVEEDDLDDELDDEESEMTPHPVYNSPSRREVARPTAPAKVPSSRNLKTADEMLASLSNKPVIPAPKPVPPQEGDSPVRTFEPRYEPVNDEGESEPEVRRFPQEYHYRPIRLDDTPDKGPV
jgi:hypothetical protein